MSNYNSFELINLVAGCRLLVHPPLQGWPAHYQTTGDKQQATS